MVAGSLTPNGHVLIPIEWPIKRLLSLLWRVFLSLTAACALIFSLAANGSDKPPRLAVIIPYTTSKAQLIFDEIWAGISSQPGAEVVRFNLDKAATEEQVKAWLEEQKPNAIITIGKTAHAHARAADLGPPIIVGGMGSAPEGNSAVVLAGDPAEFFASTRGLAPTVKRIHLVYSAAINGWWAEDAVEAAKQHQLELVLHEASSVRSGAKTYKKLLKAAQPEEDAVWIPLLSVVPSKTVLPMVLREAWDKHLVVFSNSPLHTKQGALFSLYPDNQAMGAQLAALALDQCSTDTPEPRVELAQNMKRAFNWRTASHLGLNYTLEKEAGFDRIYPVQ